jgi:hypothetical protein
VFAFVFFLIVLPVANLQARTQQPPKGSWEHWIQSIKNDGSQGLPGRPDNLALFEPLPLWVDCHLSHYFDKPSEAPKSKISKKLILRSTPKNCQGALEERSP